MAITYGKGRIFHTTEGHDVTGMSSIDFVTTLLRGTEWAATGRVTQTVPADFPTHPDVLSYRLDLAKIDSSSAKPATGPAGVPRTVVDRSRRARSDVPGCLWALRLETDQFRH